MLDHNQFHWLNCKEINCVYAYLWTELAETIANVIKKNTMVLASQNIEKSIQKLNQLRILATWQYNNHGSKKEHSIEATELTLFY